MIVLTCFLIDGRFDEGDLSGGEDVEDYDEMLVSYHHYWMETERERETGRQLKLLFLYVGRRRVVAEKKSIVICSPCE